MEQTIGWLGLGELRIFMALWESQKILDCMGPTSSEIDSVAMRIAVNSAVNMQLLSFGLWFRLTAPCTKEQPIPWSCLKPSV